MSAVERFPATEAAIAEARAAQAARENGIRAQAIQDGMKQERVKILQELGVKSYEELAKYSVLEQAHADELARVGDHHHDLVRHVASSARWSAAFVAGALGAVVAACATAAAMSSGMFGYAAVTRAVNAPAYEPPAGVPPHSYAPGEGVDHNPITGRRIAPPADAP